jgi:hypothetical protein
MHVIPKKLGKGNGMKGTHGKYGSVTPPGQFRPKGASGPKGTAKAAKFSPKSGGGYR